MSKRTPSSHFTGNNFHPQPNVQLQAAQQKKPHAGKQANAKVPKYNKFTLFWHKKSPFSQWHPCRFTVGNVTYNCAEQYMMHQKAVIFGDDRAAWNILNNEDPKEQKKLGRSVQGYNEMTWNGVCEQIVKTANMAKFSQNPKLYQELLKTAGTELAEASPFDRKWGIGLGPNNPKANDRSQWRGGNLLGRIITEVRDELIMKNSGEMHSNLQQPVMPSNNYPSSKDEESKNTNRPNQQSLSTKSPNTEKERTGSRLYQNQSESLKKSCNIKDHRTIKDYSEQRPSAKVSKYNKFTLFWHKKSPFSQWHPCRFTVGNVAYNCAEQYMMHQKAVIFGDDRTAWNILHIDDPGEQKKLGRSVQGYNEMIWNGVCEQIVKTANMAKFSQNPKLYQELLKTAGTELAEASPFDRKWGIGLEPNNPKANDRSQWRGGNLLGRIITEVRDELIMKNSGEMHSTLQQPVMPSNNYPSFKEEESKNTNRLNQQSLSTKSPNAQKERTGSRFDQNQPSSSGESHSIKDHQKDKNYSEQRPSEEHIRHHVSKKYNEADECQSTSNRSKKRKHSEISDKHSHNHHRKKSSHKKRRESRDD